MSDTPPATLGYASANVPTARQPRVRAGAVMMFSGLGMIFLGGCFVIGIMIMLTPGNLGAGFGPPPATPPPITSGEIWVLILIHILAAGCFASALLFFKLGIAWLRKTVA